MSSYVYDAVGVVFAFLNHLMTRLINTSRFLGLAASSGAATPGWGREGTGAVEEEPGVLGHLG